MLQCDAMMGDVAEAVEASIDEDALLVKDA